MRKHSFKIGLLTLLNFAASLASGGGITVTGASCESQINPNGIGVANPRLGWKLESARRGARQTAYQILVATDPSLLTSGKPDLWDSGKVSDSASIGIPYAGNPLGSGLRVWWQARVWDQQDTPGSYCAPQTWDMGLLDKRDWHGKWISDGQPLPQRDEDHYSPDPAPLLRKDFHLTNPVKRARLYVSGLGYHEIRLNGGKVGDQVLEPGWTAYDKRVPYSVHDVTSMLQAGENAIGLMLGNGWFNPLPLRMWGHRVFREELTVGRPRAIVQLNIEYKDGTTSQVTSDESWKTTKGPILRNSIYLGEVYDARREIPGWDQPGFDDKDWQPVSTANDELGPLVTLAAPPIRITGEIKPQRESSPAAGIHIYDFGQNFTGLVRYRFKAPAGCRIVMRYGELLEPDGSLNPMTSVAGQIKGKRPDMGGSGAPRIAWQEDTYIAKGGGEETYTPRFTFHGFRYVEITGLPDALPLTSLTGLRVHSDVADAGSFTCSDEGFNRIQEMCRRTFVSNLVGVQSDCPHRERLAYGGDIVATSEALLMNYDMHGFYQKTVRDWADSVRPDGRLTDTAPFVGIDYCGVGWAMAHPLLISQLYRYHGDRRLLEEQYQVAVRWLATVAAEFPSGIVTKGLGDHESLVPAPTPPLVTALYYQSAKMLEDMARTLGHNEDETGFAKLAEHIKRAYQKEFFDPDPGKAGNGSQANQAFALYSGLVPQDLRPLAFERLLEGIRKRQGHLSTGIFGTKFMLEELTREGHPQTAFTIVNQADMPGWRWMLSNGATTLWENWAGSDNTYSQNHPMFGSVSQWFFQGIGGIRPAHDAVGFDKIIIAPQPVGDLQWAKTEYQSARGLIASEWRKNDGRFVLKATIPTGTTAEVSVPAKHPSDVKEGGTPAAEAEGLRFLRMQHDAAVFSVESGIYEFSAPTAETR